MVDDTASHNVPWLYLPVNRGATYTSYKHLNTGRGMGLARGVAGNGTGKWQGVTLLHFSAQRKHLLRDTLVGYQYRDQSRLWLS